MATIKQVQVGSTIYDVEATTMPEAKLTWGGQNFSGSYGPIDAAMVPELGANRLAFTGASNANAVVVEYSRNAGSTWTDYGASQTDKVNLFNGNGTSFVIGKATSSSIATNQYQLRITINTSIGNIYTALNKFVISVSTNGSNSNWCTIRARLQSNYEAGTDTWTTVATKIPVSGWSGYNVINTSSITTYGNAKTTQYGQVQFIFGCNTGSTGTYAGLTVQKIFGYGGVGWTTPSTLAKTGQMYTYDSSQNVTFPAGVKATSFTENDTALSSKYLGIKAKAADADKLDNHDSSYFAVKGSATGGATPGTNSTGAHTHSVTINTYSAATTNIKATASGTAVGADGTATVVKSYPGATSRLTTTSVTGVSGSTTASKATAGTARKIGNANVGTAIACDDITSWSAGSMTVTGVTLVLTPPSLSYTARSIVPAVTSSDTITPYTFADVTVPKAATSATTVATGAVAPGGAGDIVMVGLGTASTTTALTGVKVTAQPAITLATGATAGTGVISVATGINSGTASVNTNSKGDHSHTVNSHTHTQN